LKKLYPIFFENLKSQDANVRLWAAKRIGDIAGSGLELFAKKKAEKKFLDIWFSNEIDKDNNLKEEIRQQLVSLSSRQLFEVVRERARNPKNKSKAENLLKELVHCIKPK